MAENKTRDVAKLLGVELEEEFKIEGHLAKYKFTEAGLMHWPIYEDKWVRSASLNDLIAGELTIIKLPKQILTNKEKEYLSSVINPFRDRIVWIKKVGSPAQNYEYIKICYQDHIYSIVLSFPDFKVGTMYRGMEMDKEYTLEKLDL